MSTVLVPTNQASLEQAGNAAAMIGMLADETARAVLEQLRQANKQTAAETDSELIEEWLGQCGRSVKIRTLRAYCSDVSALFSYFGGSDVTSLEFTGSIHGEDKTEEFTFITGGLEMVGMIASHLREYKSHLRQSGFSKHTQARMISSIRSLFSYAHDMGYLLVNPGKSVKPESISKEKTKRLLSEEEVVRMFAATRRQRDNLILRMLYRLGCRCGELRMLKWRDIAFAEDGQEAVIRLFGEKTDQERHITINGSLVADLAAWQLAEVGEDDHVFRSQRTGGALDGSMYHRIVSGAAKRAGIEKSVSPHWLRHSHASHALDRGAPVHVLRETLGHSSLETTGGYTRGRAGDSSSKYLAI